MKKKTCECDRPSCGNCSGSGEGMYDGSTCTQCKGMGVMPCACEIEAAEYAQYLHDEAEWDAYKERLYEDLHRSADVREGKYLKDNDNGEI